MIAAERPHTPFRHRENENTKARFWLEGALREADVLLVRIGSSKGTHDHAEQEIVRLETLQIEIEADIPQVGKDAITRDRAAAVVEEIDQLLERTRRAEQK